MINRHYVGTINYDRTLLLLILSANNDEEFSRSLSATDISPVNSINLCGLFKAKAIFGEEQLIDLISFFIGKSTFVDYSMSKPSL